MYIVFLILVVIFLFYLLGKSADLVVDNSTKLAKEFGLPLVLVGIVLGILTTLPELSLGINVISRGVPAMSVGNLLGGIFVMLSLVLGLSLFFNRRVATDGKISTLLPLFLYLMFPVVLGLDGSYGYFDGMIMVVGFVLWVLFTYFGSDRGIRFKLVTINNKQLTVQTLLIVFGGLAILFLSHFIVEITLVLLDKLTISPFLVGILGFSIGTNLPELSIAWQSRKRGAGNLSVSHLFGSVAANVLCLGLLSFSGGVSLIVGTAFYNYLGILLLLLLALAVFYKTDKSFSRKEGILLLFFYLAFVSLQLFFGAF